MHDVGLIRDEVALDEVPKKLWVAVAAKALGKPPSFGAEEIETVFDFLFCKRFEGKHPVVAGGSVNKDQRVACPANRHRVPKTNVHMNFVQVAVVRAVDMPLPRRALGMVA